MKKIIKVKDAKLVFVTKKIFLHNFDFINNQSVIIMQKKTQINADKKKWPLKRKEKGLTQYKFEGFL